MKKIFFVFLVLPTILSFSLSDVYAMTKGFSANTFIPAVDNSPYITQYASSTLKFGEFVEGISATYAYRSLQLTQGSTRIRGIMDHAFIQNFSFAMGLPDDYLQLGVLIPIGWVLNIKDPTVPNAPGNNKMAMGDIGLNAKVNILNLEKYPVGFSILPFVTIPTGRGAYFFGDGAFSGGGKFILEFKPIDDLSITFNPGVLVRNKFIYQGVEYYNQLLLGLGASYKILDWLSITAEINNKARLNGLYKNKYEIPLEALTAAKINVGKGFILTGGVGGGIIYGSEVPLVRGFAGLTYSPPPKIIETP